MRAINLSSYPCFLRRKQENSDGLVQLWLGSHQRFDFSQKLHFRPNIRLRPKSGRRFSRSRMLPKYCQCILTCIYVGSTNRTNTTQRQNDIECLKYARNIEAGPYVGTILSNIMLAKRWIQFESVSDFQ